MIQVTLKDGTQKQYEQGVSVLDVARDLSEGLARAACAGKINGEMVDLRTPITENVDLEIVTFNDSEGKWAFRHTAAHILAQAVTDLFPEAKLAIGPSIEEGFYYDFDVPNPFTPEDLDEIQKRAEEIIEENLEISKFYLSKNDALEKYRELDEKYKIELIEDFNANSYSFYKQGDFFDMCRGPHIYSTGIVKAFRI